MFVQGNNARNSVAIKYEIFDHLIYPISLKLDDNSVIQLFRKLHIMSTIDYKIKYDEWMDQSMANLPGFTEKEAQILFTTFKVYFHESEYFSPFSEQSKNIQNSRYDNSKFVDTVDVRFFGLFFAIQLFYQRSKLHFSIDTRDKNPSSISNSNNNVFSNFNNSNNLNLNNYSSPLSSPRGKGCFSSRTPNYMETQLVYNFIKNNLKLFLRLVASDIHNTETCLNSNEFNTLLFFFKFSKNENVENSNNIFIKKNQSNIFQNYNNLNNPSSKSFSALTPFFVNSSTTKINIETLNEWLVNLIQNIGSNNLNQSIGSNINSLTTSYSDISEDFVSLKNLSKCVTIKDNIQNKFLKISNCEDSYIYINANVFCAKISNCNNCTIFVGSVSKITTIEKCENCIFIIATNLLRVSNTIDSSIYSYSVNPPILFGDNRALVLAPHNIYFNGMLNLIKLANFPPITNTQITNFSAAVCLNEPCYQVMKPSDFSSTVLPFANDKPGYLPLCAKEYVEVLKEREVIIQSIKNSIKQANLAEEQEKALHVAIQGYFREWLVSSGNVKNLTEIVKMIDISNSYYNNNSINNGTSHFSNNDKKISRYDD